MGTKVERPETAASVWRTETWGRLQLRGQGSTLARNARVKTETPSQGPDGSVMFCRTLFWRKFKEKISKGRQCINTKCINTIPGNDREDVRLKRGAPSKRLTHKISQGRRGCELSQTQISRDHKIKLFLKGRINNLVSKWRSLVKNQEEVQIKDF